MPFPFAALAPIIGSVAGSLLSRDADQTATQNVNVPEYLQPFLNQSSQVGSGALSQLQQLSGGNLVAPFNPLQQLGMSQGADIAQGGGGFLPTALNALMSSAGGQGLGGFLDPSALSALQGIAGGASGIDPAALQTLQGIASGDQLGAGHQQFVDAAARAALPQTVSRFGTRGGVGAATGGLAQQDFGRQVADASMRFQDAARNRQVQASSLLGGFGLTQQGNQLSASNTLGGLGSTERGRQLQSALQLPSLATYGPNLLNQIGGQQQGLAQREIDAPIGAQGNLLQLALQIPGAYGSLYGQGQTTQFPGNPVSGALGGGMLGQALSQGFGSGVPANASQILQPIPQWQIPNRI